ncbi:hypothetical protein L1987_54265 [Smallanthus sonchifolius]|uniref:Uncharacterized protein n=1 Tax=Smallanthus sonchifolius TaxID=185202 RepID=A0ACB9E7Q4_9ASTR|nr:hypothetical protein L1987_54265 [Smallanthus sonchifolius]
MERYADSSPTKANTKTEDKNVDLRETTTNDKDMNSEESEAKGEEATQIETKDSAPTKADTKTKTKDNNHKGMNSAESKAKGVEDTQIEIKDTETETESDDKDELRKEITDGIVIKHKDMDLAESKEKREDATQTKTKGYADSASTADDTEANDRLRNLIANGDWNAVFYKLKETKMIKEKLNSDDNTLLHIVVGISHNSLIMSILPLIPVNDLTEITNSNGSTVLHIAAIVGNTYAAKCLVEREKKLLHILDNEGETPLYKAYKNMHLDTIAYLLEATEDYKEGKNEGPEAINVSPKGRKKCQDHEEGKNKGPEAINVDQKGKEQGHVHRTDLIAANVDGRDKPKSSLLPPVDIGVDLLVNAISAKQYGE